MFRISVRTPPTGPVTLAIDGRLDADAAAAVVGELADRGLSSDEVALDLSGLTGIDDPGIRLLRVLRKDGARLSNCPDTILGLVFDDWEEQERNGS